MWEKIPSLQTKNNPNKNQRHNLMSKPPAD